MTSETCLLKMPSKFVAMDANEMEYLDGGYWFDQSTSTVAKVIDVSVALASFGMLASMKIGQVAAKMGWEWIQKKVKSAIESAGLNATIAASAVNVLATAVDFSVGNGVAWILDGIDKSGRNDRIQF